MIPLLGTGSNKLQLFRDELESHKNELIIAADTLITRRYSMKRNGDIRTYKYSYFHSYFHNIRNNNFGKMIIINMFKLEMGKVYFWSRLILLSDFDKL